MCVVNRAEWHLSHIWPIGVFRLPEQNFNIEGTWLDIFKYFRYNATTSVDKKFCVDSFISPGVAEFLTS